MSLSLRIELCSDTTFGAGGGVPGLVDIEIEHDLETGLPVIHGRTLKGLLVEECANLLDAMKAGDNPGLEKLASLAENLFGSPGSEQDIQGEISIGRAEISTAVRQQLRTAAVKMARGEVLQALTDIRGQTAMDAAGVPDGGSLRYSRLALRGLVFKSEIWTQRDLAPEEINLLALCCRSLRRGGLSRNRGRGKLRVDLWQADSEFDTDSAIQWLESLNREAS